jgi:methyl-branched lipid omega-hydroxylase
LVVVVDLEHGGGGRHAEPVAFALEIVDFNTHPLSLPESGLDRTSTISPVEPQLKSSWCANKNSRRFAVVEPTYALTADQIDLSDIEFWTRSLAEREGAFHTLRSDAPLAYFEEPVIEVDGFTPGRGYYAVTKYADILEISKNPELFCSGKGATSINDMPEFMNDFFGSMINMDDPRHARLRKIVSAAFTPKMLKKVEDDVARAAKEIVDEVLRDGGGDFVTQVAARLPLKVICDMMGIPESAYDEIFLRSNEILGGADPEYHSQDDPNKVVERLLMAGGSLHALVSELGASRRANPTEDLTSALVNASVDGEQLNDSELGSFFILLVVAGNETTRNAIAHALDLLTQNPEQRAVLMSDLDARLPGAVEEIVRVASPVVWMRRTATKATSLRGQQFEEGDKFILYYWSANRDDEVFSNPFAFDITRSPNPHVGFGGPGPHFCLGAHLARREITVMLRELLTRAPNVRATGEADRLRSSFINGIKHLPFAV